MHAACLRVRATVAMKRISRNQEIGRAMWRESYRAKRVESRRKVRFRGRMMTAFGLIECQVRVSDAERLEPSQRAIEI